MSLPMIKKISTFEKVEQPDPDLPSHLRNLIKKVLPGISEDRLKEILAMRSVVLPDPLEELLPPELVEELFTGDDHKMVQDSYECRVCKDNTYCICLVHVFFLTGS